MSQAQSGLRLALPLWIPQEDRLCIQIELCLTLSPWFSHSRGASSSIQVLEPFGALGPYPERRCTPHSRWRQAIGEHIWSGVSELFPSRRPCGHRVLWFERSIEVNLPRVALCRVRRRSWWRNHQIGTCLFRRHEQPIYQVQMFV